MWIWVFVTVTPSFLGDTVLPESTDGFASPAGDSGRDSLHGRMWANKACILKNLTP